MLWILGLGKRDLGVGHLLVRSGSRAKMDFLGKSERLEIWEHEGGVWQQRLIVEGY
jgi:hypothetical protein